MQLIVHGRNMEVTNWIEEYAGKRVRRLERYLPQLNEVRAELAHTPTRAAGDRFTVQLTMWSNGQILRAEESTSDVFASIDAAVDKIAEQVRRFQDRTQKNRRRASAAVQMKASPRRPFKGCIAQKTGRALKRTAISELFVSRQKSIQMGIADHDPRGSVINAGLAGSGSGAKLKLTRQLK